MHYTHIQKNLLDFSRKVLKAFIKSESAMRAGALTFSTMLTLVPFLITIFSMIRFLPIYESSVYKMQSFVVMNFVPSFGAEILTAFQGFEEKADKLPAFSLFILFITVILLLMTIERTMNNAWGVVDKRRAWLSILMHWLLLVLGPLLLIASMLFSSFFASLEWLNFHNILSASNIIKLTAFCLSLISFSLMYLMIPNCRVSLSHALAGGLFAALLFEIAKKLVKIYLLYVPTHSALYGALAAFPVLLIWIHLVWLIFLLGSHIVNTLRLQDQKPLVDA